MALASLLDAHRNHLRRLADQSLPERLKARVDASDIVQQTCLSVFRQIQHFEGGDSAQFLAWMARIQERNLQNVIRDQLHTQKRGDGREAPLAADEAETASQNTPSQHAMRREEMAQLAHALQHLPAEEQDVLRLRYLDEQTLPQIAAQLELSKEAVVWRLQKGLKRLREFFPLRGES